MALAYLSLGSNLGDRAANLWEAFHLVAAHTDARRLCVSSLFESEPVGPVEQPNYLNAAARIDTGMAPDELLHQLKWIESKMGRSPGARWGPRTIDLDILLFAEIQLDTPELTIPHREIWRRRFVLEPLLQVIDDRKLEATAQAALSGLPETPRVWAYRPIAPGVPPDQSVVG